MGPEGHGRTEGSRVIRSDYGERKSEKDVEEKGDAEEGERRTLSLLDVRDVMVALNWRVTYVDG